MKAATKSSILCNKFLKGDCSASCEFVHPRPDDIIAAGGEFANKRTYRICSFHPRASGCIKGDACTYLHILPRTRGQPLGESKEPSAVHSRWANLFDGDETRLPVQRASATIRRSEALEQGRGQPEVLQALSQLRGKACSIAKARASCEMLANLAAVQHAVAVEKAFMSKIVELAAWADAQLATLGGCADLVDG